MNREFAKINHYEDFDFNREVQSVEFVFGDSKNCYKIGSAYYSADITVRRKDDASWDENSQKRLVNNGFTFCSKEASIYTTVGSLMGKNVEVGTISTMMRVWTSWGQDLQSGLDSFDKATVVPTVTAEKKH